MFGSDMELSLREEVGTYVSGREGERCNIKPLGSLCAAAFQKTGDGAGVGVGYRAQVGLSSSLQLMEGKDNEARQDGHDLARDFRLRRRLLGGCLKGPVLSTLHKKLLISLAHPPCGLLCLHLSPKNLCQPSSIQAL